jgi:hypothetical protein
MTAVSSVLVVVIRGGAMRSFSRIFCGIGVAVTDRFGAFCGVKRRWARGLFPGNDPEQNNPEKNIVLNQSFMRKAQSHLRVICATPF